MKIRYGRGNVRSGKFFSREMSSRGSVLWGSVRSENCPFGQMSVGEVSVRDLPSGKCPVGKVSYNRNLVFVWYMQYVLHNFYTLSYTNFIYIFSKFYPIRSFDCRWTKNLIVLLYKRNICSFTWKLNFVLFLSHFLVSISTIFLNVEATPMNKRWLKFQN